MDTGAGNANGRPFEARGAVSSHEPLCMTYGDGVGDIDVAALIAFHKDHGKLATVTAVRPAGRFGR